MKLGKILAWKIKFTETSQKQLRKLDKQVTIRILNWLEERIANSNNPRLWGKALTSNEAGKWRYRVGDYRIVCEIIDNELIVKVVKVANRQSVYD
jgi:mRNA interferase RelE/StbE